MAHQLRKQCFSQCIETKPLRVALHVQPPEKYIFHPPHYFIFINNLPKCAFGQFPISIIAPFSLFTLSVWYDDPLVTISIFEGQP